MATRRIPIQFQQGDADSTRLEKLRRLAADVESLFSSIGAGGGPASDFLTQAEADLLYAPIGTGGGDVFSTRTLLAGAGLTGGGNLSANRVFDVGAGEGITVNANDVEIANNGVTNIKLADMPEATIKGRRNAIGDGDPQDIPFSELSALIGGTLSHGSLSGLSADDHPQYTAWAQSESIVQSWEWRIGGVQQWVIDAASVRQTIPLFAHIPTNSTNRSVMHVVGPGGVGKDGGFEIQLIDTITPGNDMGVQLGLWEGSIAGDFIYPPFAAGSGYAWRNEGDEDSAGDLVFRSYVASASGTEIYRHWRDAAQMGFANGTASLPTITFGIDRVTGIYRVTGSTLGITTGGALRFSVSATVVTSTLPWNGPNGSNTAPAVGFSGDTNTGMYLIAGDQLGFATDGTLRLSILTSEIVSTLRLAVPDGNAATPGYGFSSDIDNGMFRVAANTLGFATAGTERLRLNADGAWGLGGANFGTDGQVLTSHGTALPPTFEDQSGGGGGGGSLVYVNTTIEAGDTIANTASELAFDASYNIPADTLTDGSVVRVRVFGTYSTDAVPPTLRLRLKLDTTTVLDSGAVQTIAFDGGWMLEAQLVAQTGGATGDLEAQGWMELETTGDTGQVINLENSSPFTVDMTQALTVTLTAQWSGADTDNSITLRQMAIWIDEAAVAPTAAAPASATYLTEDDETAVLPNSRALLAGTGVTFDDTVAGERTINTSANPTGDQYWALVAALLHFDGADASTTFTDQKGNAYTASGNAQLDTAQFQFGTASLLLDGTDDFVSTPDRSQWTLGDEDFTIEGWVRLNLLTTAQIFLSHYNATGNQRGWFFGISATDQLRFGYSVNGTTVVDVVVTWGPSTGVWHHVAVTRNGAELRLFVDGTQLGATHDISNSNIFNSTAQLRFGGLADGTTDFNGWLDEWRITLGIARYTANFTAPTEAFPDTGLVF